MRTVSKRMMATRTAVAAAVLVLGADLRAEQLTLAVDVPTELGGTTYLANQTVERADGAYGLRFDGPAKNLGADVNIDALLLLEDGSFLFSMDAPFSDQGSNFLPRDVVRFDGDTFTLQVDGGALGLSDEANVDALARDDQGRLILSFDAPETVQGATYQPDDLALLDAGILSLAASGDDLGLPPGTDVTGLEQARDGAWYVMFDTPTSTGGTIFLPGEIVRIDSNGAGSFFSDPGFPANSAGNGFSFPGSPGEAEMLRLARNGNDVTLDWSASCSVEAQDYAVYEGTIGDWSSHVPKSCSTAGQTTTDVTPENGDRYYLVVAVNGMFEGSYGSSSSGERPAANAGNTCRTMQRFATCP